jgi:predicted KAP-like P-loop ATPase
MADHITRPPFSADRPITSRSADLLGRGVFAESLAPAVMGWKGLDSLIAPYGPWGSGKSSIKNMTLEALREPGKDCPSIVEFNPRQWVGAEQLAEAFFHEICVALGRSDPSKALEI